MCSWSSFPKVIFNELRQFRRVSGTCLVSFISPNISNMDAFCAFCDDFGLALGNPWRDLPLLSRLFSTIAKASNLCMNNKSRFLPMWSSFSIRSCNLVIRELVLEWSSTLSTVACVPYLGFAYGLLAMHQEWRKACASFSARLIVLKKCGLGFAAIILIQHFC